METASLRGSTVALGDLVSSATTAFSAAVAVARGWPRSRSATSMSSDRLENAMRTSSGTASISNSPSASIVTI